MNFAVTLDISPPTTTHHAKRIGRGRLVNSAELKEVERTYALALAASGKKPPRPLRGAIVIAYDFVFAGDAAEYHVAKPDGDNLQKTLQDALVRAGWIEKDETVCAWFGVKRRGLHPHIEIQAAELNPQTGDEIVITFSHDDPVVIEKSTQHVRENSEIPG